MTKSVQKACSMDITQSKKGGLKQKTEGKTDPNEKNVGMVLKKRKKCVILY